MGCKLFDQVAFGKHKFVGPHNFPLAIDRLRSAVLLDAADLAEPYRHWRSGAKGPIDSALVKCKSPFRNMFVYAGQWGVCTLGMHVETLRADDPPAYGKPFSLWQATRDALTDPKWLAVGQPDAGKAIVEAMDNGGELVRIITWVNAPGRGVSCGRMIINVVLDDSGKFVVKYGSVAMGGTFFGDASEDFHATFPLFAIQLMHCRNIVLSEHDPYRPLMPRGKRNKVPKITYHTLRISSSLVKCDSQSARDGQVGESCNAKHVCRGNFAHYTEEKKLFGKYVGMFWRPMHIRGNAKHGIVGKEYAMEPPQ